jgi:hypothetical protein
MPLIPRRVLALACIIVTLSCGSEPSGPEGGDLQEPPDVFTRTGLPPPIVGVRWIASTGPGGGTREYYENVLESRGEKFEIGVRQHLVVSDGATGQQKHYEWTDYLFPYQPPGAPLIDTIKLSGVVAVDTVTGPLGPLTVYRFDNPAITEGFRTLVRFPEALVLPGLAGIAAASPDIGATIPLHATATAERVVVTDLVSDVTGFKIRLRVGDELVTRLRRLAAFPPYELSPTSAGTSLIFQSSRDEPTDGRRDPVQAFQFKAVAPGWVDLTFDRNGPTFRVKVE